MAREPKMVKAPKTKIQKCGQCEYYQSGPKPAGVRYKFDDEGKEYEEPVMSEGSCTFHRHPVNTSKPLCIAMRVKSDALPDVKQVASIPARQ